MLCWQTRRVLCYHKEASLVNTHITSLSTCPRWELQKYLQMLKTHRKRFFLPWHKLKVPSIKVDFVGKEVVPVIRKAQLTFKDQERDFCVVVPQDGLLWEDIFRWHKMDIFHCSIHSYIFIAFSTHIKIKTTKWPILILSLRELHTQVIKKCLVPNWREKTVVGQSQLVRLSLDQFFATKSGGRSHTYKSLSLSWSQN